MLQEFLHNFLHNLTFRPLLLFFYPDSCSGS